MELCNNTIFNTVNNGIVILDEDLNILAWNNWLEIFTKLKEEDIVGKNICSSFPYIDEKKLKRKAKTVLTTKAPTFLSLDTNRFLIDIPVSNITNKIFKSMQQDITILPYDVENKLICIYIYDNTLMCEINHKLEKANAELVDMSHRDPLTQLYNRRYFSDQSEKLKLLSGRSENKIVPISLLILDIDKFKRINDTYGHLVGDDVIIKVARFLEEEVRDSDIVSRFGGEEFLMLLYDCDVDQAYKVAEKIRLNIYNTVIPAPNYREVKFTISIGVAQFDVDGDANDLEYTLSRADHALFEAKETGRNRTVLSTELEG